MALWKSHLVRGAGIHRSLRVTPAMAAGVAKSCWTVEDLVGLP